LSSAQPPDQASRSLDLKLLVAFLQTLNIARRNLSAYPPDHPMVSTSLQRVVETLRSLLEFREHLSLGVGQDNLFLGSNALDPKNPVFRDLARTLFRMGVAAIAFHRNLTIAEASRLCTLLQPKTESGPVTPLAQQLQQERIRYVQVKGIDYTAIRTVDPALNSKEDTSQLIPVSSNIWERFVQGILRQQALDYDGNLLQDFDPHKLAEFISKRRKTPEGKDAGIIAENDSFWRQLTDAEVVSETQRKDLEKIGEFIQKLSPELRRQFLDSTFNGMASRQETAEKVFSRFPCELLLEVLEDIGKKQAVVSPMVLSLLSKLAKNKGKSTSDADLAHQTDRTILEKKLRTIFREDESEQFNPQAYQSILDEIVARDELSSPDLQQLEELKKDLLDQNIEHQASTVILELLKLVPVEEQADILRRNLLELSEHFLGTGGFSSLVEIHNKLRSDLKNRPDLPPKVIQELEDIFGRPEFVTEVLDGLHIWGKEKYADISRLIVQVGAPFAAPIVDRLGTESSMSLRRYFMARLVELGDSALRAILPSLRDERWFLVRNLVIILRELNRPEAASSIRPLLQHDDQRVRQEVLKTLLFYRDPQANDHIRLELAEKDHDRILNAVVLAEQSRSPEILADLLALLRRWEWRANGYELKSAVVKTLGEIGDAQALPLLVQLIHSGNILHPRLHSRLQENIVRSFAKYPPQDVSIPLEKLTHSRKKNLARIANAALKTVRSKTS